MQELPDALPSLSDFTSKEKPYDVKSHWIKTPKNKQRPVHECEAFVKLTPQAQTQVEATFQKMSKKNASCKYLTHSFVGLNVATLEKAKRAFDSDGGRIQLSDGRNTGSFGVTSDQLADILDPKGWTNDEVRV
jgi:hypothetical protein